MTFWSPKWRSLNPWEGHFKPPKGSLRRTLNNNSRGQEYCFSRLFALGAWLQGADQRFEGRALTIDAAPLPSDIFWENFDCPTTMRRLKTLLVGFLKASFMWYFLPYFWTYVFLFLVVLWILVSQEMFINLLLWEEGGVKNRTGCRVIFGFPSILWPIGCRKQNLYRCSTWSQKSQKKTTIKRNDPCKLMRI